MKLSKKQAARLGIFEESKAATKDRVKSQSSPSLFEAQAMAYGLPRPIAEYEFCEGRKWRFDWLFLDWLALEIDGGAFSQGRHTRGEGFIADMEKLNEAQILGFVVLRVTPQQVESGEAFALVKRALEENV